MSDTKPTVMAGKKARREQAKRLTRDGLPRDGRDWTESDWKDLHECVEEAKRRIAGRHQETGGES